MKLLGTNIDATDLIAKIEARLRARGLLTPPRTPMTSISVEPPVEPLTFNLQAL